MKKTFLTTIVTVTICAACACLTEAAALEPLFQITSLSGTCQVQTPDMTALTDAEEGRAYPYGTQVQTRRNSSAVILLSAGNECKIGPDTVLVVTEDTANNTLKILSLSSGKVEVTLEPDFKKYGGLNVMTPTATCSAEGTSFSIETGAEGAMAVTVVGVKEGVVRAWGMHFSADALEMDDVISIASALDQSFTRIKIVNGNVDLSLPDSDGSTKIVPLETGSVVKIHRRVLETGDVLITIIITAPDGTVRDTWSVTETAPLVPVTGVGVVPPVTVTPAEGKVTPTTTSTTTTSTTTTVTTIPSPTPVGKR